MWICGYVAAIEDKNHAQKCRDGELYAGYPPSYPSYPRLSTKLSPTYPRKFVFSVGKFGLFHPICEQRMAKEAIKCICRLPLPFADSEFEK